MWGFTVFLSFCCKERNLSESSRATGGTFMKVVSDTGLVFSPSLPSPFTLLYFFLFFPFTPTPKSGDRTHTILFSLSDPGGSKGGRGRGSGAARCADWYGPCPAPDLLSFRIRDYDFFTYWSAIGRWPLTPATFAYRRFQRPKWNKHTHTGRKSDE